MKLYWVVLLGFISIWAISSCSHPPQPPPHPSSIFEQIKLEKLSQLQRSILRVTCSANYQNYFYSYPSDQADTSLQENLLQGKNRTTNSVAGTGLILYQDFRNMVLLTCHHLFDFKDTLKTYYIDKHGQPTKFLHSLSVKLGQNILVFHMSGWSSLGKIIAVDERNDLALIETTRDEILLSESPFAGPFGNAEKIKLGQEIYLLGFPKGYFMVTRGLASPSPYKNRFMIDAPFNAGFSGGTAIVFTEEGDYKLIGMANAVAYNSEAVLVPPDEPNIYELYQNLPYDGEIYVKDLRLINYGLTFVIKSNVILDFLHQERERLKQLGYDLPVHIKE